MSTLAEVLAQTTREGTLYDRLPDGRLRCFACGHRCPIPEGAVGVCKVRFNRGGRLLRAVGLRRRRAVRPDREEAVLPRASGRAGLQLRHARLRPALRLLPELGHVAGAARSAGRRAAARRHARSAGRATRVALGRARSSSAPTTSRSSRASGRSRSSRQAQRGRAGDRLRLERQRHAAGARVPAPVGRPLQGRSQELRRPPLPRARRPARSRSSTRSGGCTRWASGSRSSRCSFPASTTRDDELTRLTAFVAGVSPDIPWHVTAFHPDYKMTDPAEHDAGDAAPRGRRSAGRAGLRYVYAGNLPGGVGDLEDTRCPRCRRTAGRAARLPRSASYRLTADGACPRAARRSPAAGAHARPRTAGRRIRPSGCGVSPSLGAS